MCSCLHCMYRCMASKSWQGDVHTLHVHVAARMLSHVRHFIILRIDFSSGMYMYVHILTPAAVLYSGLLNTS